MKAKRLIAMLLCAMMLISLLPAAVFADEDEEIVEVSFDAEEEILPEEEIIEDEEFPAEDETAEDEVLPEEDEIAAEPETDAAENEFEAAAGTCGSSAIWSLTNSGVLTIKGTGNMDDYSVSNPGWLNSGIIVRTIKVEEGITSIGSYAFYSLRDAAEISLPGSLLNIDKCAFMDCGITEIEIPAFVKSIGERAFAKNLGLTVIRFDGNAPDIASDAFTDVSATVYYSKSTGTWTDSNKLNYGGKLNWMSEKSISGTLGENITWELVNRVLTISGTGEMDGSNGIPWKEYISSIESVIITKGVTSICDDAFSYCENIIDITLPDTLKVIGENAFEDCRKLPNIIIPNSVTSIKAGAFSGCGFENITIPASVTELGDNALKFCNLLTEINIEGTASGFKSVDGVMFSADGRTLVVYPAGRNDESYTIPNGVTIIDDYAFYWGYYLKSVTVPNTVQIINAKAFIYCNIKTINLPDSITVIGNGAFFGCTLLAEVTIPSGVTVIGDDAFRKCYDLKTVKFKGNAPDIGSDVFVNDTITAYYPAGNATWTDGVMQQYGGTITWEEYCQHDLMHHPACAPTTEADGCVEYWNCTKCGKYFLDAGAEKETAAGAVIIPRLEPDPEPTPEPTPTPDPEPTPDPVKKPVPVLNTPANHANYMILVWNKVEGAVSYQLAYREGSSPWTITDVPLTAVDSKGNPRINIKDLKHGVTYTYIAYALFEDGTKTKSASIAQTRLLTPDVTAKAGNGFINLTWNAVEGGSQYKIYYREKGGSWQLYTWVKKDVLSINIKESITNTDGRTPLTKGKTYEFAVILGTSVPGITSGFPTNPVSVVY